MGQPNQQPIQEEIKNKPPVKTNWKLLAIVAAFAFIAGGAILLLKTIQAPVAQTPQSVPSPQPQTLDTSGWQTYRNDEFGFEVKYPKDCSIREIFLGRTDHLKQEERPLMFSFGAPRPDLSSSSINLYINPSSLVSSCVWENERSNVMRIEKKVETVEIYLCSSSGTGEYRFSTLLERQDTFNQISPPSNSLTKIRLKVH
jgi:hypothetical protein